MPDSKKRLRSAFRALREDLGADERARVDEQIFQQVTRLPEYKAASCLLTYLSFGSEVDTRGVIRDAWAQGKAVALPRCVPGTRQMTWHCVESFDGLIVSPFGVEEPAPDEATQIDPAALSEHALALVPGLTFDMQGYRLGYGGGFYDVFLSSFPGVAIGLCRECQISDRIEVLDAHDLPVSTVVTESRVLHSCIK